MTIRGNVLTLRCLIGPWKLNRGTTFRRSLTTTLEAIAPPSEEEVCRLVEFFNGKSCVVTISGAGISTASGIPDYRGPNGSYRKGHVPIKHQEFLRSEAVRKRYWLRSMYGWPRLARAKPNLAHVAVSRLEGAGIVESVVTQNVDRLHQLSGSTQVVDLHGRIDQVICMDCQIRFSRSLIQEHLCDLNPLIASSIDSSSSQQMRADGDLEIDLSEEMRAAFQIPCCPRCQGMLKPDVVFFGDNVPLDRVNSVTSMIDRADGVLVVGSSLEVFSAYRFVVRASSLSLPIAIINFGETRAERQKLPGVTFKSAASCGELLHSAVDRLLSTGR